MTNSVSAIGIGHRFPGDIQRCRHKFGLQDKWFGRGLSQR